MAGVRILCDNQVELRVKLVRRQGKRQVSLRRWLRVDNGEVVATKGWLSFPAEGIEGVIGALFALKMRMEHKAHKWAIPVPGTVLSDDRPSTSMRERILAFFLRTNGTEFYGQEIIRALGATKEDEIRLCYRLFRFMAAEGVLIRRVEGRRHYYRLTEPVKGSSDNGSGRMVAKEG